MQCDLELEDRNPTVLQDTPGHDDAPSHKVWVQTVQWFGRYLPDKGVTDRQTDNLVSKGWGGGGVGGYNKQTVPMSTCS